MKTLGSYTLHVSLLFTKVDSLNKLLLSYKTDWRYDLDLEIEMPGQVSYSIIGVLQKAHSYSNRSNAPSKSHPTISSQ